MKKLPESLKKYLPAKEKVFSPLGAINLLMVVMLVLYMSVVRVEKAEAALLSASSIQLSDSRPGNAGGSAVTYTTKFTFPGTTSIQCINIKFGQTSALSSKPTGMTTTSAVKGTITGGGLTDGNWTLYNTVDGTLQYEYSTGEVSTATQVTIPTTTITNPTGATFYAQVTTYSTLTTHTCSGVVDESNVMALTTVGGVSVSATVDPSISFSLANYGSAVNGSAAPGITTSSSTIPFGTLTPATAVVGAHTATVSTNASGGYILYVRYTGALSNGVQTIADTTGSNGSPAGFSGSGSTSAFGYITDDSDESQFTSDTWAKFTTSNAEVARAASAVDSDANHVAYQVEASNTQAPGDYTTTVVYTVTPSY